MTDTIW